jgi:AcrR family transcriptional regulator
MRFSAAIPAVDAGPSARRPRGDETRERILEVALTLFNERGYDKTSLREIAERLDVTKAALYYHFDRKEDILLELDRRLGAVGSEVLDELEHLAEEDVMRAWPDLLDRFIDHVLDNCRLFLFRQRNQNALDALAGGDGHRVEREGLEQRVRRVLANPAIPLADRVRMACSIGGVVSALMGASGVFGEVPKADLAGLVREAVHDLFPPVTAPRSTETAPASMRRRG